MWVYFLEEDSEPFLLPDRGVRQRYKLSKPRLPNVSVFLQIASTLALEVASYWSAIYVCLVSLNRSGFN